MPKVQVVFYKDDRGRAPALEWLDQLPPKVRDKFIVRFERLKECGSELRRPEADMLRDGIYELRVRRMNVNYRALYFFVGSCAVVSHGLTKMDRVPDKDIDRAIAWRGAFVREPHRHTHEESGRADYNEGEKEDYRCC